MCYTREEKLLLVKSLVCNPSQKKPQHYQYISLLSFFKGVKSTISCAETQLNISTTQWVSVEMWLGTWVITGP